MLVHEVINWMAWQQTWNTEKNAHTHVHLYAYLFRLSSVEFIILTGSVKFYIHKFIATIIVPSIHTHTTSKLICDWLHIFNTFLIIMFCGCGGGCCYYLFSNESRSFDFFGIFVLTPFRYFVYKYYSWHFYASSTFSVYPKTNQNDLNP